MTLRVWIAGEGANDLGGWDAPHVRNVDDRGVVVALLQRVRSSGWVVERAFRWKDLPKYRTGGHRGAEQRAVLGLVQRAKESKAGAVAFIRDRDGTRSGSDGRDAEIEAAIAEAATELPGHPPIAGGVAVERIESWILALVGERGTEAMSDGNVDQALAERRIAAKDTAAFVAAIDAADLTGLPDDAASLRLWLERARVALGSP